MCSFQLVNDLLRTYVLEYWIQGRWLRGRKKIRESNFEGINGVGIMIV